VTFKAARRGSTAAAGDLVLLAHHSVTLTLLICVRAAPRSGLALGLRIWQPNVCSAHCAATRFGLAACRAHWCHSAPWMAVPLCWLAAATAL
jgi:hypothetical protein